MNWFYPPVWEQIVNACRKVGHPFEPAAIKQLLVAHNPTQFEPLGHQRLSEWIDRSHTD